MEKQRRRQFFLICFSLIATLYNILPTIFYYSHPLREPVGTAGAEKVAAEIVDRVGNLEQEAKQWIASYCALLELHPSSIVTEEPQTILVSFARLEEARLLRSRLPKAGALIPFAPAQLFLGFQDEDSPVVAVQRPLSFGLDAADFCYIPQGGQTELFDLSPSSSGASGYLVLDQEKLAKKAVAQMQNTLQSLWHPAHSDLKETSILDFEVYQTLAEDQKTFGLIVASPLNASLEGAKSLKADSLYVVAKGMEPMLSFYAQFPDSKEAEIFYSDFRKLVDILQSNGFSGYLGSESSSPLANSGDIVFEKPFFLRPYLKASREDFRADANQKKAWLVLSDHEQRLLTKNKIETAMHEELIQAKDAYRAAQISLDPRARFDAPPPIKSVFWNNLALSVRKYFRGDERKVLKWGLDLSGGKTVQIELRDSQGRVITQPEDLKQGMQEIQRRVNRLGVSEVAMRQVGHHIVLDFPGSQARSASELIQASTMVFHVVNEKFSSADASSDLFLQEVWNEACLTGQKDPQSVNQIAKRRLELASASMQQGLRFAAHEDQEASSDVDEKFSKIVILRGSDARDWQGRSHPLLVVFRNWVMEGADLENIHVGYDASKGNFLSFDVSSKRDCKGKNVFPKKDLYNWTSLYSKQNKSREKASRMAVVLNDSVVSAPVLESVLEGSAMISGSFSQREANLLSSDLKAGSLTFSPHIILEKNVSPELGVADRVQGISATIVALILCVGSMILYYRFAGVIASVAVLLNLLILWAVLQNIGAALTLAGLAGVILTVGMAVDANVLVFERIKEEFALSGHLRSAIAAGYKKAYSAIIDSNLTTMIAAVILLNFDAGPVKSFAINLIIGIASSLFTALFMTRFYFSGWVENPKNQVLKMADWIRSTHFDFLKWAKISALMASAIICIGGSLAFFHRASMFGMDFTGGYSLNLDLGSEKGSVSALEKALVVAGAAASDFHIQELTPPGNYRILFGTALDLPGRPFASMAQGGLERAGWVVSALESGGFGLASRGISLSDLQWTAMSGQLSSTVRHHAMIGFALCLTMIFIYLAFRFEYKFAMAAILCVMHDVFITLGFMGLLHAWGVPMQIDLNTMAALMTIVGYSLNDTIIIFDRIREELRAHPEKKFYDLVNQALNATLSRTLMTSGTTLLVLLALVFFGGSSIFGFALVMTAGVFFGTLSSWFIASPLAIFFHRRRVS